MAIPSSGAVSLLDIANEFGGSAPHSINEYYGKATGIPSSGTISFSDFRGKSSALATATLTGGATFDYVYGFVSSGYFGSTGSISPTTYFVTGSAIQALYSFNKASGGAITVKFFVAGSTTNSGWTTLTVGSTAFTRASATFTSNSSQSSWTWTNAAAGIPGSGTTAVSWS